MAQTTPDPASILNAVEPFIRNAVRRFPRHERDDAAQNIRLHLLQTAIPAYAPERGALKSYLFRCIENCAVEQHRQFGRHKCRAALPIDEHDKAAPDAAIDRAVEELAGLILDNPDQHLSAAKARILRAVTSSPHATGAEIADRLGLSVTTLWPQLARIRDEITSLLSARCA